MTIIMKASLPHSSPSVPSLELLKEYSFLSPIVVALMPIILNAKWMVEGVKDEKEERSSYGKDRHHCNLVLFSVPHNL